MAKVSVIIPAAGSGRRFGARESKILQPIGGRPVFLRSVDAFAAREDVCEIQLVLSAADAGEVARRFAGELKAVGVRLIAGGPTRSQSVRGALAGVSEDAELVCVHDAVRPCVRPEWIDAVFAQAHRTGAAILACPLHGTIKRARPDGVIAETLCRDGLWEAQTPQVFRRDILLAAYARGTDATDDAELVQAGGHPVTVVACDRRNVKITTPADLRFARAVFDSLQQ